MKTLLSASGLAFLIMYTSCTKNISKCKGQSVADCICTKEYNPVCGCDGKTYGNPCEANCAGVKTWVMGACK